MFLVEDHRAWPTWRKVLLFVLMLFLFRGAVLPGLLLTMHFRVRPKHSSELSEK
jgi:hypothetical protein